MNDFSSPYRFRPISTWPGDLTRAVDRRRSPFRAPHANPKKPGGDTTMKALARELEWLGAKDVVVELALREADLRVDGMPRARAKPPEHPGVILSFDSDFGPLRYACDAFLEWPHNLRAITLGLEHLRAVDRYGITKRGEQYTGWKQIAAASQSADDARGLLLAVVEAHGNPGPDLYELNDARLVRRARKATHPDTRAEGTPDHLWDAVEHAAGTLGVA